MCQALHTICASPPHLDAGLPRAHVAAAQAELAHARERQLAQVALLDARRDERHGDVALDAVHAHPRRHQRQQPRDLAAHAGATMLRFRALTSHASSAGKHAAPEARSLESNKMQQQPAASWQSGLYL